MKLLNPSEASVFLGPSRGTLAVWRCHGKGPAYIKIGARVMYSLSALEAFARANTKRPGGKKRAA